MFGELGVPELLVILGIALLIFGPKKIGELGKSLGEGIRGFRSAIKDEPPKAAVPVVAPAVIELPVVEQQPPVVEHSEPIKQ